jgi:predicted nucleotidyltransferase
MIGISADFDPVHKGHVELIDKAKEISNETGDKVVIYLNKGYSANHAPFFTSYESREKMALKAGADEIVAIEGLHHRLTLSYSVPIRIAMMIENGVVDYVDAANVSTEKIQEYSKKFVNQGIFVGIPRNLPNRNVIRWFAVNEFLQKKYDRKMKFHIISELKMGDKVSGRDIRKSIIKNHMEIPENVKDLLPKSTIKILEREIKKGNVPGERNWENIYKRLNTCSRPNLMRIAYLNGNAINEIVKNRVYRDYESIWASLRRAKYGPVLTRLSISAIEEGVTREEVLNLMKNYEKKGVIPPEQNINKVIERAWFVASETQKGVLAHDADKLFKNRKIRDDSSQLDSLLLNNDSLDNIQLNNSLSNNNLLDNNLLDNYLLDNYLLNNHLLDNYLLDNSQLNNLPLTIDGGLNLTKFETKKLNEGTNAKLYVDKNGKISCEMRESKFKIKTNLKLPAKEATYIRYIIDSHFIPITAKIVKNNRGFRVRIDIQK